jgi:hypothetical protein
LPNPTPALLGGKQSDKTTPAFFIHRRRYAIDANV